jgi:AraC-like DNA-binding protein
MIYVSSTVMADRKERAPVLEHLARLPVAASELVQLDPGDLGLTRIDVRGRDSFIVRARTGARSIWTTVPEADWVGYTIPITWEGDYLLNGMRATRTTVFKLDGANEYDVVAKSRDFITVGLRRSVLARTISGLIGRDFAIAVDMHRQLQVPKAHRQMLLAMVCKLISGASSNRSGNNIYRLPRSIEVAFIEDIADWTVKTDQLNTSEPVARKNELKIFRDSMCKIREADHSLLTIADLCHMVGVGKSHLYKCFESVHGITPGQFLQCRRLTSVRRDLTDVENLPRSVKDVGLKYGFVNLGRFAQSYRQYFGEYPSQTLEASRKRMGARVGAPGR